MKSQFERVIKDLKWGLVWVLVLFLIGLVIIIAPYVPVFYRHPIADDPTRWMEFGSYFGPMLAGISSFATLLVLVVTALASSLLPVAFEESRSAADRIKATIDISRILYDREYYIYVSTPTWEIAVKWLYWEGPDGDEYRRAVSGTKFLHEGSYEAFTFPEDVNRQPYQNLIRFEPHTMPYGYGGRTTAISELSEHEALNLWIQFWCRLQALLAHRLVDETLARTLFADWYRVWLGFMLQLRFVGQTIEETIKGEAKISWFSQIAEIEKVLFRNDANYEQAVTHAKARAADIVKKTMELDASGRSHR